MSGGDSNDEGGRRKPPQGRRFGPSNPGRRTGRRKGARNVKTIVEEIAREKHTVKHGDEMRRLTTVALVFEALKRKALEGDVRAIRLLDRLRERFCREESETGLLLVPDDMEPQEWIRRAEIRNKFAKKPGS
ncbi:DUF5681 domain-containing protein [Nitratireductor sp. GCM10026969]|uniref:DUF5681 domain-containing protein n=1 Tax=Nitratireductor sp. GCM10026969 TaxID=3252645 RepID=UPI0036123DEA